MELSPPPAQIASVNWDVLSARAEEGVGSKTPNSSGTLGKDEVLGGLCHHTPSHNPIKFLGTLTETGL